MFLKNFDQANGVLIEVACLIKVLCSFGARPGILRGKDNLITGIYCMNSESQSSPPWSLMSEHKR